jgi:hypothetical protein
MACRFSHDPDFDDFIFPSNTSLSQLHHEKEQFGRSLNFGRSAAQGRKHVAYPTLAGPRRLQWCAKCRGRELIIWPRRKGEGLFFSETFISIQAPNFNPPGNTPHPLHSSKM